LSAPVVATLERLLGDVESVGLDTLDERSALQRRVDRKYVADLEIADRLVGALAGDYDALDIDGRRLFRYESVYFDTPDLDCFNDQVADRKPRYKVRSRLYVDSDECSFEVKLKLEDASTAKEHGPCAPDSHGRLVPEAREFVDSTLREAGLEPPDRLDPVLITRFGRGTLAARDGSARVTFDVDLHLEEPGSGASARIHDELVIIETKTFDGDGRADRLLHDAGLEDVSLSKYRAGVALLTAGRDADGERARQRQSWFERER
jgi:VTC domain